MIPEQKQFIKEHCKHDGIAIIGVWIGTNSTVTQNVRLDYINMNKPFQNQVDEDFQHSVGENAKFG